jgi:hypothetical protein
MKTKETAALTEATSKKTLKEGYNRVMLYVEPEIQLQLEAYGGMRGKPFWRVTEDAFRHYLHSLPAADRSLIEANVERRKKEIDADKKAKKRADQA